MNNFMVAAQLGGGVSLGLIYLVVIGLAFYFFIFRPNKKQKSQFDQMLESLKVGDDVVTRSGVKGKIVSVDDVGTLINRLQQLEKNGINAVDIALQQLKTEVKGTAPSLEQISDKVSQVGNEFNLASQRAQEFANLKSQVLSFFTITGAVQLFRQAVQSAFETVKELDKAIVVPPEELPQNVITMNSKALINLDGEDMEISLVFPQDSDWEENKLSIFSPIGTALIGYKEGDAVEWELPTGEKTEIYIKEIVYQPEAAGHFHL